MNVTAWLAVLVVIVMVWALVKRYETRLVLITAGIALAMLTLKPMDALDAFAKSMTNAGLIEAICSAMGFAFVISYTRCDEHLVTLLSKPLGRLGLFLVPASAAVTFFVNTAIPSAAGCAAAVGATLIPLMMRSGIHPAGAAAAVLVGTYGSMLSPGMSHNVFVAKIAKMDIMALIAHHAPFSAVMMGIGVVGVTIACFLYKDHRAIAVGAIGTDVAGAAVAGAEAKPAAITQANALYALAPFVPLTLLVVGNAWVPALKMGVPQAMIIGAVFALAVTRVSPAKMTNEFFNGMGKAYGDVIGIIIAAGVFAAGLKTAGLIDLFIDTLEALERDRALGRLDRPVPDGRDLRLGRCRRLRVQRGGHAARQDLRHDDSRPRDAGRDLGRAGPHDEPGRRRGHRRLRASPRSRRSTSSSARRRR